MLSFVKANFKIVLISTVFFCFATSGSAAEKIVLYKGIINAFKLNIRTAPSQNADVLTVLAKGQPVDVVSPKGPAGSWLTVVYEGQTGYVRNREKYIRLYPAAETVQAVSKPVEKKTVLEKPAVKNDTPEIEPVGKESEKKKIQARNPESVKKDQKEQSRELEEKIIDQERLVQTFTQKEFEIIEGLNEIDYALNKARLNVKSLSLEVSEFEDRIDQLNQDKAALKKAIEIRREYAGKRLKALYKMNMIGRMDVAGMPTSIFDFFLQQNAMKRIIETDFDVLDQQNTDFEKLETLENKLQNDIKARTALEAELNDQIRINKTETLKKELILKDIRQKKRLSLAAVESLREAQIRLDNQVNSLTDGREPERVQLSFESYKGRLKFPVKGKIISTFGPSSASDDKSFTFQKGIDIRVERGEPVKSVFKGNVIFAQWLKGYGNLLIIDHGDNYYTLYAHVEEIFKQKGETVDKGDVIATAGDTGSIKGMCLHFEVRHHGKPVNPIQWFQKGA